LIPARLTLRGDRADIVIAGSNLNEDSGVLNRWRMIVLKQLAIASALIALCVPLSPFEQALHDLVRDAR